MWIGQCHVVPFLDADGEEGFSCNVSRELVTTVTVDGKPEESKTTITRGKINSIKLAIQYAKVWSDVDNPPELPTPWVDPEKVKPEEPKKEGEPQPETGENEPPKE